jgi:cold shock CspA family protein
VAEFDEPRGLGVVEYGPGHRLPFHCTAITDGSRRIDVGAVVAFEISAGRLGQLEASSVRPLPGVVRPGASLIPDDEEQPGYEDVTGPIPVTSQPAEPDVAVAAVAVAAVREEVPGAPQVETSVDVTAAAVTQEAHSPMLPDLSIRMPPEPEPARPEPVASEPWAVASDAVGSSIGQPDPAEAESVRRTGGWRTGRSGREAQPAAPSEPGLVPGSSAGGSGSGSGFFDSAPVGVERVRGMVDATPPFGTEVESDPASGSVGPSTADNASAWPLGDDPSEPSGSEASSPTTEEPPRPDFWSPFARPSSGPPPTWRTPVTKRSDPSSEGD